MNQENRNIYRLVTYGEEHSLVLRIAQSSNKKEALRELEIWADENGWVIAKKPEDLNSDEVNAIVQELVPVEKD